MLFLQIFLVLWLAVALAMSAALIRVYPQMDSWINVSRSVAWPVTLLEAFWGMLDE